MASELGIAISMFDAAVGAELSDDEIERVYDRDSNSSRFKRPMSSQEIGCYLSHKKLWKKIGSSKANAALVLEDDAVIEGDLVSFLNDLSDFNLEDVYIKMDGACDSTTDASIQQVGDFKLEQIRNIAPRTTGYILGRSAAKKLSAYQDRFFRPVDIDLKHYWEHNVPILTVLPQIVREEKRTECQSSIEASRNTLKPQSSLTRFWKNASYQTRYKWSCFTHSPNSITRLHKERSPDYV